MLIFIGVQYPINIIDAVLLYNYLKYYQQQVKEVSVFIEMG